MVHFLGILEKQNSFGKLQINIYIQNSFYDKICAVLSFYV